MYEVWFQELSNVTGEELGSEMCIGTVETKKEAESLVEQYQIGGNAAWYDIMN